MIEDSLIRLRELGAMTGAPTWIPKVAIEIEELLARVEQLEREHENLTRQLAFYRGRVAA